MWVGHDGLALAQFGTRGDSYLPRRRNTDPRLAFVDAANGRILDTISLAAFSEAIPAGHVVTHHHIRQAAAIILPDGRLRAMIEVRGVWFIWTQDEPPRRWGEFDPRSMVRVAFAAGGTQLVLVRDLQPNGPQMSHAPPDLPPPQPVEGTLASLYDVATERPLWSVNAAATHFWSTRPVVVSESGQHGLLQLPDDEAGSRVALIDMRTGREIQVFRLPSEYLTFGFAASDSLVWLKTEHVAIRFRAAGPGSAAYSSSIRQRT